MHARQGIHTPHPRAQASRHTHTRIIARAHTQWHAHASTHTHTYPNYESAHTQKHTHTFPCQDAQARKCTDSPARPTTHARTHARTHPRACAHTQRAANKRHEWVRAWLCADLLFVCFLSLVRQASSSCSSVRPAAHRVLEGQPFGPKLVASCSDCVTASGR